MDGLELLLHCCYRGGGEQLHPALMVMSLDPGEVARMAESGGVRRLYLTHFRIHMDSEAENAAAKRHLARYLLAKQALWKTCRNMEFEIDVVV